MNNAYCLFQGVFSIENSDPLQLPVRDLEQSISYYKQALGFTVLSQLATPYKQVLLQRDQVTMGLAENGGVPEDTSCYFMVSNIDGLLQELQNKQLDVSPIRVDVYGGRAYQVFFLRAPDGLCFCFSQEQEAPGKD